MPMEDAFNGAKNAFAFFSAYVNMAAQEIGMERALALHTKTTEELGGIQGKMMKEQTGDQEVDAKAAYSLVKALPESLGITFEVLEESPAMVRFSCKRCSVYEGAQMAGMDKNVTESMCRAGSIPCMNAAVKQLNPRLSYQLTKYRSGPDDFCEEQIVLA
jgi:hypothetical protein